MVSRGPRSHARTSNLLTLNPLRMILGLIRQSTHEGLSHFVESADVEPSEDDPWSDPPIDSRRAVTNGTPAAGQLSLPDVDTTDDARATAGGDYDHPISQNQAKYVSDIPEEYDESDSVNEIISLHELEDELETDSEASLVDFEGDTEFLDEPEPFAEYDGELADPLYEPADERVVSGLEIRLDLFIASVQLPGSEQREVIRSILSNFSSTRLANWLPWLETKEWNDHDLLLYLEFRELWDSNPDWWERWTWVRRYGARTTHTNASILNRDSTYDLLQHRLECEPDEVIDSTWFEEWDYYAMWKHGFYSFASFAIFRAQIEDYDDWKRLVTWNHYDGLSVDWIHTAVEYQFIGGEAKYMADQSSSRLHVWEAELPHRAFPSGPPAWFAVQDWYESEEWHDNLGWTATAIELTDPNLSPQSAQGSLWPTGGRDV